MPYSYKNSKGVLYFLHSRSTGKNGKGRLYYFSKEQKENSVDVVPGGYEVSENSRTGMPLIKKLAKENPA